jgi:hypothetical protein
MSEWRERHLWAQALGQSNERQADGLRLALATAVIALIPIAAVAFIHTTLFGQYSAPAFRCAWNG